MTQPAKSEINPDVRELQENARNRIRAVGEESLTPAKPNTIGNMPTRMARSPQNYVVGEKGYIA